MTGTVTERLVSAGMSDGEARRKAEMFDAAAQQLPAGHRYEVMQWFVPGRIEVLGKHTDYAGGRSLLCTAERGFCVAAVPRRDSVVQISDVVRQQGVEFDMAPDLAIAPSGWRAFPMVVARRLARNFPGQLCGAQIAFASDLPPAAGMSSSSALLTAIFTVLSEVNRLTERSEFKASIHSVEDLAGYLGCIENGQTYKSLPGDSGVGTFGGSEDHTAILASEPGQLKQYAFCPVRLERTVRLPAGCVFVVAVSGVVADKTGAARAQYNRASEATRAILQVWRAKTGSNARTLAEVASGSPDAADQLRHLLRQYGADARGLGNRFEQFWIESEFIIPQACDALASNDLAKFGSLVDQSQAAAEALLENQVPETVWLAREARSLGAYAASAFGAGFGGSVWALVEQRQAVQFVDQWRERYLASSHPAATRAEFIITMAGISRTRL